MELTSNGKKVLETRYLLKNDEGKIIESPEQMLRRVADTVAEAETNNKVEWSNKFYDIMDNLRFLPNSPCLFNAGKKNQMLSACFVLGVPDDLEGIFNTLRDSALIQKAGGGCGYSFSHLRPKNDLIASTKGTSSGVVSFMRVFDVMADVIKQGGVRRSAQMAILRVDHPEILGFIHAKSDEHILNCFNISVGVTDAFMDAVKNNGEYDLVNPRNNQVSGKLQAREVFKEIARQAWSNGEPGLVFLDTVNKGNPTPGIGVIESTNPCGEQPLLNGESCNLGSINLSKFLLPSGLIDYVDLEKVTRVAVRFLDDVIDVNSYPLPKIREMTLGNRKIGLGVMGFADLLYMMNIPYVSEQGLQVADKVMGFINKVALDESNKISEEKGVFPNWPKSIYADSIKLRNATVTTIAPTGSISIIAGCSSGVEPLFSLIYERHILDRQVFLEVNPIFKKYLVENFSIDEVNLIMSKVSENGSCQRIDRIPIGKRQVFVTALDIRPEYHVRMQAVFQRNISNAVSKTVNMPNSSTVKDVEDIFMLAYELKCKGITVYRDKSRSIQVLTAGDKKND